MRRGVTASKAGVDGDLKVMLVSPLPPPAGGIATWTRTLLASLSYGHDVDLRHIDTGVRWKSLVTRTLPVVLVGGSLQAFWDIGRVTINMVKMRPDVLHLTSTAGFASLKDVLILGLARLFGVTGVLHYHTSILPQLQITAPRQWHLAQLSMGRATTVVVLDQHTENCLESRLPPGKLRRIPNMISIDEIDQIAAPQQTSPSDRHILLYVGMLIREKGVLDLVEACLELDEIDLHMIGSIEPRCHEQLKQLAARRDGGRWVTVHGPLDKEATCGWMNDSAVVVLPSWREAFPYTILESLALRKPVVATEVGAMPEIIDAAGKAPCGLCVPPGDVHALRQALKEIFKDSKRRCEMGEAGRRRVISNYSADQITDELVGTWRRARSGQQNTDLS